MMDHCVEQELWSCIDGEKTNDRDLAKVLHESVRAIKGKIECRITINPSYTEKKNPKDYTV